MKLITYATHNTGYFQALKESAENNKFELVIIGYGTKWEGFTKRIEDITNYLKKLNKNELVCIIDAFDCIVLGDSNELKNKYLKLNTNKILFSASRDNAIMEKLFGKINNIDLKKEFNRLVAGAYIGFSGEIINLFDKMCSIEKCENDKDDQMLLTHYYNSCKDCLVLDNNGDFFYNIDFHKNIISGFFDILSGTQDKDPLPLDSDYYIFQNNRIILNNGMKPIILHGNGNLNLDNFVEKLNLTGRVVQNRKYYDYSTKKFFKKIREEHPLITTFLKYFLKFIHIIMMFLPIYIVIYSNNVLLLSLLILIMAIGILLWYLLGYCLLSPIENALDDSDRSSEASFITNTASKAFGNNLKLILSIYPIVIIIICLIKINKSFNNCVIKKIYKKK